MNGIWYHGTDCDFERWVIPPPRSVSVLEVSHTSIFFTKDLNFARNAGTRVYETSIISPSKIVDMTKLSDDSENIRKEVIRNRLASFNFHYKNLVSWRDSWISGDALRMAANSIAGLAAIAAQLEKSKIIIEDALIQKNLDPSVAADISVTNMTRGLIEHICNCANKLGYTGIYGYEIDRFSMTSKKKIEWLAIFDEKIIAPPKLQQ